MMSFFKFFKSKYFFIHTGLILVVIFLIVFGILKYLESYTNHGKYVVVPDFTGKKIAELPALISSGEVTYQIIDSIYDPRQKSGIVLRQDPIAKSKVKHNRTVYLYVTGMVPPQIVMPKLIDRSERQARLILQTYGLKTGTVTEAAADCNGCIVAQSIKGLDIEPGATVQKGSTIDLVVGRKGKFFNTNNDTTNVDQEPQ
jgi:eukaryotic-like serine/threonine-protein kinase